MRMSVTGTLSTPKPYTADILVHVDGCVQHQDAKDEVAYILDMHKVLVKAVRDQAVLMKSLLCQGCGKADVTVPKEIVRESLTNLESVLGEEK